MALQHLRSSTADKRPTPAAMSDGQLAMNTNLASPGLFFKDSNGDSVKIGPVHVGTTAPNVTPGAGGQAGNSVGEAWLDTTAANPILKVFNGSAFVAVQPVGTGTVVSTTDTGTVTSTMILDGTILNADINASAAIVDTKLATIATGGKVSNSATTATNANTASAIVARDASGNFTAGTITAALTGAASSNVLKAGDTMTGALVVPLASAATPSLTFTGDLNTGIFSPGADQVAISTNGTEKLIVLSNGNVGIGTSSPNTRLHVFGGDLKVQKGGTFTDVSEITFSNVFRTGQILSSYTNPASTAETYLAFHTNRAGENNDTVGEAMRIAGGRVGIGTTSPATTLDVNGDVTITDKIIHGGDTNTAIRFPAADTVAVETNGSERARIDSSGRLLVGTSTAIPTPFPGIFQVNYGVGYTADFGRFTNDIFGGFINFVHGRGGSPGVRGIVQNGDILGLLEFVGDDGVTLNSSAGNIRCEVDGTPGAGDMPGRLVFSTTADGAATPTERMRIDNAGTITFSAYGAGTLSTSASGVISASDGRYKTKTRQLESGLDAIAALEPTYYRWNEGSPFESEYEELGFVAQEVAAVIPEASPGEDEEGKYRNYHDRAIIAMLVKGMQEQQSIITALTARVAALEAN